MSNRKTHIFLISGPSGSGKSSIIKKFLKEDKSVIFSVSFTTRKRRDYEVDGRDYLFISKETFEGMIKKGLFLEWEEIHGELYGTPKESIIKAKKAGKDICLDVDVNGALKIKRICEDAVLIFVMPPSREALIERLKKRGEVEIQRRLDRFEEEVEKSKDFDYIIVNDNLEKAYEEFKKLIKNIRRGVNGQDHR